MRTSLLLVAWACLAAPVPAVAAVQFLGGGTSAEVARLQVGAISQVDATSPSSTYLDLSATHGPYFSGYATSFVTPGGFASFGDSVLLASAELWTDAKTNLQVIPPPDWTLPTVTLDASAAYTTYFEILDEPTRVDITFLTGDAVLGGGAVATGSFHLTNETTGDSVLLRNSSFATGYGVEPEVVLGVGVYSVAVEWGRSWSFDFVGDSINAATSGDLFMFFEDIASGTAPVPEAASCVVWLGLGAAVTWRRRRTM